MTSHLLVQIYSHKINIYSLGIYPILFIYISCYFPIDDTTNYHKLSGLKQHKLIISWF